MMNIFNNCFSISNTATILIILVTPKLYLPSSPPDCQKKERSFLDIFHEEFWKEKARIAARANSNL